MKKARIVKRTLGEYTAYTIQQRHFLFFWWWVDAWVNSSSGAACDDTFSTMEEAEGNLHLFDGTKTKEEVVLSK
jgi:hypothetical protein